MILAGVVLSVPSEAVQMAIVTGVFGLLTAIFVRVGKIHTAVNSRLDARDERIESLETIVRDLGGTVPPRHVDASVPGAPQGKPQQPVGQSTRQGPSGRP